MLEFFGGVPELVVPDNLKSGVVKPCRYEPVLTRTYEDLAAHYGVAVIPARVRKPKDKAKVETGVLVVERWILASLRHRQFHTLGELNAAIAELLERLNDRPFKKLPGNRRSLFEALDQPALGPLPRAPYEYADWSKVRVGPDYHVEVDGHHYSVPYQLVGEELEARLTATTVEVLHADKRVACHPRSFERGQATTLPEHMPPAHRGYAEETPQKLLAWGEKVGPATSQVVETILSRRHPKQGFQSCVGLRRLARDYGESRLESACQRAIAINGMTYTSLCSILRKNLDQHEVKEPASDHLPRAHENVRGASYYESSRVEEAA
jgi:transposase